MTLTALRSAMQRYASRFDAARITAREATLVVEDAAAIEKMAATVKALAAARVAETKLWRSGGDLSAAHQLARKAGTSVTQAQEILTTAKRLEQLPAVTAAAKAGELSPQQTAAIADAATVDPEAEVQLLERALRASLGELRQACARTKANATDLEARRRRIHERRSLRTYTDAEGAANLHWRDNPERIAEFMETLEPLRDRVLREARKHGRREPYDAHGADAMLELARRASSRSNSTAKPNRNTKILVRVDLPTLLRGHPVEDETCEIVGYGPVAVSAVRDMVDSGDPFLAAIVTRGEQVMGVAHLGRRFTAHQKSALEWLYPTCAVEGCNALAHLELDHREDWAKTHITLTDIADRPCGHHHYLKTHEGWAFVDGHGKRPFVPPDDPRHPRTRTPRRARPHDRRRGAVPGGIEQELS